ncbi:MAG: YdcF family protein [Stellaceae bacterium]
MLIPNCRAQTGADAIVVLGCPPSARLTRRIERGTRLWHEKRAPLLLLSGGGRGPKPEAEIMRGMALLGGVPPAALLIEPNSRDTLGNARETARLLRAHRLQSVLLVSDRTHLPRAALLFRLAGVAVAGRSGVRSHSRLVELAAALRELTALPWSLARALWPG